MCIGAESTPTKSCARLTVAAHWGNVSSPSEVGGFVLHNASTASVRCRSLGSGPQVTSTGHRAISWSQSIRAAKRSSAQHLKSQREVGWTTANVPKLAEASNFSAAL